MVLRFCAFRKMEPVIQLRKGATKWDIRQKVWDYIETNNLANFPRPVHNRIPNFKGAAQACDRLRALQEFGSSTVVKVNPDRPQERARYNTLDGAQGACGKLADLEFFSQTAEIKVDPDKPLEGARLATLQAGKTLLVPTPRLRTGLFNKIVPPKGASKEDLRVCSTSQGVKEFSVPIGLEAKVKVDLVVVGSVAVSEKGLRVGKGEGFADMEYAMMASMGAVSPSTVVLTIVHDCQVLDIPAELIEGHDLTVDYILTPTRLIRTGCTLPKPTGITWAKVEVEMLQRIPVLQKLRALEQAAGKDVTLRELPAGAEGSRGEAKPRPNHRGAERAPPPRPGQGADAVGERETGAPPRQAPDSTLYLGGLPEGLRVSELKGALREGGAQPLRVVWQGGRRRAFLLYADGGAASHALELLQGLTVGGHALRPEPARPKRDRPRQSQRKTRAALAMATDLTGDRSQRTLLD